ncbi:LOB domain-containing protein 38-like [Tripterygium wilfordii]|uniref:LOB domain-containing protein 38-like n=1 Tax=Tripterygium wilfordii TaxID=458696 RepID=A0A7J7D079_TRIWF|nr:LOB domain-containing protein 39-like [Tripterygium wilfordii]KAF5739466.1 LOB domain-containing protein 38-like [Tripterygium wilfordii]
MSCNGCRVLRKGCSENCVLRSCLHWIDTPEAQANATLFLAKFFGRSDLMSFVSSVPEPHRPALFQSLLFEACGRTVNPVNGAVGLLWSRNWHVCQAAVETVLSGGVLRPIHGISGGSFFADACVYPQSDDPFLMQNKAFGFNNQYSGMCEGRLTTTSFYAAEESEIIMTSFNSGSSEKMRRDEEERKLLNLFI